MEAVSDPSSWQIAELDISRRSSFQGRGVDGELRSLEFDSSRNRTLIHRVRVIFPHLSYHRGYAPPRG
jgi:hypothetical protein